MHCCSSQLAVHCSAWHVTCLQGCIALHSWDAQSRQRVMHGAKLALQPAKYSLFQISCCNNCKVPSTCVAENEAGCIIMLPVKTERPLPQSVGWMPQPKIHNIPQNVAWGKRGMPCNGIVDLAARPCHARTITAYPRKQTMLDDEQRTHYVACTSEHMLNVVQHDTSC